MAKTKPLRVVIDTNLWVSFIISGKQRLLDTLLFSGKIRILLSAELITEIQVTIAKPRIKKHFGAGAIEEMLSVFEPFTDLIEIKSSVTVCRDSKDDFLLALAKDGKADYLLTGDKDLLELVKFGKTKIETISAFIEKMKRL